MRWRTFGDGHGILGSVGVILQRSKLLRKTTQNVEEWEAGVENVNCQSDALKAAACYGSKVSQKLAV